MLLDLPVEIHRLIIEEATCLAHTLSFLTDLPALYALCLVSQHFHHLATPYLYSSVVIPTIERLQMVQITAKSKPDVILHCRTLMFAQIFAGNAGSIWRGQEVIAAARSLRRLYVEDASITIPCANFMAFDPEDGFTLDLHVETPCFDHLQRLAIKHVFFRGSAIANAIIQMHRLTHLAIASVNAGGVFLQHISEIMSLIMLAKRMERIILGFNGSVDSGSQPSFDVWSSKLLSGVPKVQSIKVVFLAYGTPDDERESSWFEDRIVDGTVWDIEN
jgi:hypothetical protein